MAHLDHTDLCPIGQPSDKDSNYNVITGESMRRLTLCPVARKASANCVLTVDLPTPPLPLSTTMTFFTLSSIFKKTVFLILTKAISISSAQQMNQLLSRAAHSCLKRAVKTAT